MPISIATRIGTPGPMETGHHALMDVGQVQYEYGTTALKWQASRQQICKILENLNCIDTEMVVG